MKRHQRGHDVGVEYGPKEITLTANLVDAQQNDPFGRIAIPFVMD